MIFVALCGPRIWEYHLSHTKPGAHSGMQSNLGARKIAKALLGLCKI